MNVLKLKDDFAVDYEAAYGNYENLMINIRASDLLGLYIDQMFEIEVDIISLSTPATTESCLPMLQCLRSSHSW